MKIGRYEVQGEIARGGFGVVLRARDPALNRPVAIKVLLAGAGAGDVQRKRFEREVKALARLRHPNIVAVHEAGFAREGPFVVMDLIEGESLERRMELGGPLPVRDAVRLMEVVARAIAHAHAQNLLHRDLKPANVLLDAKGTPLVTDFGLAREVDPRLSMTALSRSGASLGTPGFWPPEQAYGQLEQIGPASDVYGLGATLYALLTGDPPYVASSVIEVLGLMASPPRPPSELRPEVPAALDAVVLKAMAHEPAERYPSAEAFAAALVDARRHLAAGGGRSPRVAGVVAALGLLSVGAVAVAVALARREAPRVTDAGPAVVAPTEPSPPPAVTEPPPSSPSTEPAPPPPPASDPVADAIDGLTGDVPRDVLRQRARDAVALASRLLVERADHVDALLLRARARAVLEDYPGAAQDAALGLTLAPDRPDGLLIRALIRRDEQDPESVLQDVQRLLDLPPGAAPPEMQAQAYALRAWARDKLGLTTGALEDYTAAIALRPRAEWLVEVGMISLRLEQLDEALSDFTGALAIDPDNVLGRLNRAGVYLKKGELDLALEDADHAVEVMPDSAWVWLRRVEVHAARADWASGLADADHAVKLDPDRADVWVQRAYIRRLAGDEAGAAADYREALLREPGRPDLLRHLAVLLAHAGDLDGAKAALDEALRAAPRDVDCYMKRAEVLEELGDLQAALADYGAALTHDPERWEAYYNRGMLRGRMKDDAGALADYDQAIKRNDREYQAFLNRGDLKRRMGDAKGAIEDLERAAALLAETGAEDPNIDLALAMAHVVAKDYERAEALLTEYLKHVPDRARIIAERGIVRERRGDAAGALADYRRAHELTATDDPDRIHPFTAKRIEALEPIVGQGQ